MLPADIRLNPIVWQCLEVSRRRFTEVAAERGVILEDQDAVDAPVQGVFKDVDVRLVAAPCAASLPPPLRVLAEAAIDGLDDFHFAERPVCWYAFHKRIQPVVAAFERYYDDSFKEIFHLALLASAAAAALSGFDLGLFNLQVAVFARYIGNNLDFIQALDAILRA